MINPEKEWEEAKRESVRSISEKLDFYTSFKNTPENIKETAERLKEISKLVVKEKDAAICTALLTVVEITVYTPGKLSILLTLLKSLVDMEDVDDFPEAGERKVYNA